MVKINVTGRAAYILFVIIALVFIFVKISSFGYSISDENTSFYMAKLMAEGKTVYKDFFYAHPPLQIYLLAFIYKIFGFNFLLLKLTPLVFTLTAAFFIFRIMQRYSYISAIAASLLFLFSYEVLRASSYAMGISMTTMLVIISIYFLFEKKYLVSGIFSGLAGITGLYSLVPAAVILIFLFINLIKNKGKYEFFKFFIGFSMIFVLVNLIFILLYGNNYIIPVYKFHLLKPGGNSGIFPLLLRIVETNPLIFILPFLYFFAKKGKMLKLIAHIAIAHFLFLILFQKTFGFYFMLLFPFLAIIASYSIAKSKLKINKNIIISAAILLITASSAISAVKFIKYDFQNFNKAVEIAEFIAANSEKSEKIFGDDSAAPLIAMLSKRDIALDFADSNSLRFRAGIDDINKVIADLKKSKNRFIIVYQINFGKVTGTYGPAYINEFFSYVKKECSLAKTFKEPWQNYEKIFSVYDCKKRGNIKKQEIK